jgi:hypothetical protein
MTTARRKLKFARPACVLWRPAQHSPRLSAEVWTNENNFAKAMPLFLLAAVSHRLGREPRRAS